MFRALSCLPLRRLAATHVLRSNPSLFIPAYRPRYFFSSPHCRAAEPDNSFLTNIRNTDLFHKLADKPEALQAISNFSEMLQEEGVSMSSRPSMVTMMRLASQAKFREAAQNVMLELNNAGIDLSSRELMEEVMNARRKSEE